MTEKDTFSGNVEAAPVVEQQKGCLAKIGQVVTIDLCTPESVLSSDELRKAREDLAALDAAQKYRPPEYYTDLIAD